MRAFDFEQCLSEIFKFFVILYRVHTQHGRNHPGDPASNRMLHSRRDSPPAGRPLAWRGGAGRGCVCVRTAVAVARVADPHLHATVAPKSTDRQSERRTGESPEQCPAKSPTCHEEPTASMSNRICSERSEW